MTPTRALPNEYYVKLATPISEPGHDVSFPARIENARARGADGHWWAQPRMRPEVLRELQRWLRSHTRIRLEIPDLDSAGRPAGTVIAHVPGAEDFHSQDICPGSDGLYPVHGDEAWTWFLSVPTTSPEVIHAERSRLLTPDVLRAEPGEHYVALEEPCPAFPALIEDERGKRVASPRFRCVVAEALVAWLNHAHLTIDPSYSRGYWDNDGIVLLDDEYSGQHGYQPERIEPDADGRYLVGQTWEWSEVTD
ncbi:hypothetical protein [Amycolatopsis anabasis]|uniref:hypothetical protein n=1 Tax=Amycolatopsis anabasis TaxID=1840409 RepID=UPI00131BB989|nr:hypothetical protein [Amycolatopsis anabasis]